MKTKFFHSATTPNTSRSSFLSKIISKCHSKNINPRLLTCLKGNDVIAAKISDHQPVIHDSILFWNVMMQGKIRKGRAGGSYNNGFGFVETDEEYILRLEKIGQVIAELVYFNPSILTIGLCEGPIEDHHLKAFVQSINRFPWMHRFMENGLPDTFYRPQHAGFPNWGLLMLADNNCNVKEISCDFIEHSFLFDKLANRLQIWQLEIKGETKYFALGHFPFNGDESLTQSEKLSENGKHFCELVNNILTRFSNDARTLCADFNFNPCLIGKWQEREADQITPNNSILLLTEEAKPFSVRAVTVDGVLLSSREKQRQYNLFNGCSRKLTFYSMPDYDSLDSAAKKYLIEQRHENNFLQEEYDKCYGLTKYSC